MPLFSPFFVRVLDMWVYLCLHGPLFELVSIEHQQTKYTFVSSFVSPFFDGGGGIPEKKKKKKKQKKKNTRIIGEHGAT